MSAPLEEYLKALEITRRGDHAQEDVINAYTRLADTYAELQKTKSAPEPAAEEKKGERSSTPSRIPPSITGFRSPTPQRRASDNPSQLRADLTAANKTIHDLNMQIASFKDEVETLKSREAALQKKTEKLQSQVTKADADKTTLARRLRDKEGELKEKGRMVSEVQDEMVGMEMQVNMAEQRATKLEKENADLVARWMKRVGGEADEMNKGSGWE